MIEVMMVFHADDKPYFWSTEPSAIGDAQYWRDAGKTVIVISLDPRNVASLKTLSWSYKIP